MKYIFTLLSFLFLFSASLFGSPKASGKVTVIDSGCGNWVFTFKADTGSVVDSFSWVGPSGLSGRTAIIRHHYRISGDSESYSLTVSNHFGSRSVITGYVLIPAYVRIDLPRDTIICDSATITIPSWTSGGNKPYMYSWSNGNPSLTLKAKAHSDTSFYLQITDNNGTGCTNADTIHIKISHTPASSANVVLHGKDTLYSTCTSRYTNWYLNGNLIAFHKPYVVITQSGNYEAACVDTACESSRASYTGIVTDEQMVSFFSIYPNPAANTLTLDRNGLTDKGTLCILDLSGKEIFIINISASNNIIPVSSLKSGMYFIRYQDKDRTWNSKFVKE